MVDPGSMADAYQLLQQVLNDVKGLYTYPLAIEIQNQTKYNFVITPNYYYCPMGQFGQSGYTTVPSNVGPDTPPIRIYSPENNPKEDVGAFDGYASGLDCNIGCMSYQGYINVNNTGHTLFTFVIGWHMDNAANVHCKHAILLESGVGSYEVQSPSELFKPVNIAGQNGGSFHTVGFMGMTVYVPSKEWKRSSIYKKLAIKVPNAQGSTDSETIEIRTSLGGNVNGYTVTVEVSQVGYTPPK